MNKNRVYNRISKVKYILLFAIISLIFTSCNVEEDDANDNSSSINLNQDIETMNENTRELINKANGGEVGYKLAFKWYEGAANKMSPKALNALGHMYYEGLGVEKNVDKALEYTLQSSGFLHGYSLSNMGAIIEDEEIGGDANYWYRLAAKNYMIRSGSNDVLYDNLQNGEVKIKVNQNLEEQGIPNEFINEILFKYYSGTLYDYLETESNIFKNFDISELNVEEEHSYAASQFWRYDNHYLIDLDGDGTAELISYQLNGSAGGSRFQVLENRNDVYHLKEENISYLEYGINGFISYEGEKYFVVAVVDIGNRVIYEVNVFKLNGLQLGKMFTIELKELNTTYIQTYKVNDDLNELNSLVEKRIEEMFYDKYERRMLYDNVNEDMVVDCDINNDGDVEHYEYESMFWGTINLPINLELKGENSEDDFSIINKLISFNDLGIPLGIEIFTFEGINYIGVLSYELGTNNHCLTTFKLEKDEFTVVLNHFITFDEKFIVK